MVLLYIVCLAAIAATDLAYAAEGTCEHPDQVIWGTSCYYAPPTGVFSWEDGDAYCKDYGMELASIHSKKENDYIFEYAEEVRGITNYWFGLIRDGDSFAWTDGTAYDYENWYMGEPNNDKDMCGNLRENGQWNDLTCEGYELAIICRGERSSDVGDSCSDWIDGCRALYDENNYFPDQRCDAAEAWMNCELTLDPSCGVDTSQSSAAIDENCDNSAGYCADLVQNCRDIWEPQVDVDPEKSCSYAIALLSCIIEPEVAYQCGPYPPEDVAELRDEKCFWFYDDPDKC